MVQYLQDDEVAHAFAASYRLYVKYGSDYRVEGILDGTVAPDIMERASNAGFDERLALVHMVFGACVERAVDATGRQEALGELLKILLAVRDARAEAPVDDLVTQHVARVKRRLERSRAAGQLGREEELKLSRVLAFLERARAEAASEEGADLYELLKAGYNSQVSELRQHVARCTSALDNAFEFFETVFGDGQEMLVFVTNLTANRTAASFISEHGCDKYFEHSEQLMFHERRKDILQALDDLGL